MIDSVLPPGGQHDIEPNLDPDVRRAAGEEFRSLESYIPYGRRRSRAWRAWT